jgi:hypothetical protein
MARCHQCFSRKTERFGTGHGSNYHASCEVRASMPHGKYFVFASTLLASVIAALMAHAVCRSLKTYVNIDDWA